MGSIQKLKTLSFLVYGLGRTGLSVINFFKRNKIKNFKVWDDNNKNLLKEKRPDNLLKAFRETNFIILSPGVSLNTSVNRSHLIKYKNKIITDIDLIFLQKNFFKSIVVTGTNGKSTTSKIIHHTLKKNGYKTLLGGNIGLPILNLNIKKDHYLIIEASSFQLSHSKFICPDYALLLNLSNDHLDWHGNMKDYENSKFKIFKHQNKYQYSLINKKLKVKFKKRNLLGKLIFPRLTNYQKVKSKIKNSYLISDMNNENMSFVFALIKLLGISQRSFFKSLKTFKGMPHRYEIFLKKKNCTFINDSKATSFQATKCALENTKNIFWIVGGQPKKNDKLSIKKFKKDIIKTYIIGENVNFFKLRIKNDLNFFIAHSLKKAIIEIFKDVKKFRKKINTILLSPASASFDQYSDFEKRGDEFKRLSKSYASKYL